MDERPVEDVSKAEPAQETTSKDKPGRRLTGVKSLVALVACCGAVFWAWNSVREGMRPILGWARQLRSGDVDDRQIAARQLGDCSPEDLDVAVPSLIAAFGDKSELVRAEAAAALGTAGYTAIKARSRAAEAKAAGKGAEVNGAEAKGAEAKDVELALKRALSDDVAEVRLSAAASLGELAVATKSGDFPAEPDAVASSIAGLLEDPSMTIRKRAEIALSKIAAATSIKPPASLVEGLGRWEGREGRASAASALGWFKAGNDATVLALGKALKDKEPDVRSNAAAALRKFGLAAVPALPLLVATVDDPFVPEPPPGIPLQGAQSPAGRGGAPSGVDPATDPAVEAIKSIGQIAGSQVAKGETPSAEVIEALVKSFKSSREAIKGAAGEALRRIGKGASAAIPDLIKELAESIPQAEPGRGEQDAYLLGEIAPGTVSAPQAIAALALALDAKDPNMRIASATALGRFGPAASDVLPRLRELGGDANKGVASAAKAVGDLIEGKAPPAAPRRKNAGGGGRR